jgi:hypothetical protein
MFTGLSDVDWSSMHHAYGAAGEVPALLVALGSADADERDEALSRFYGAVHHQGDVYRCTVASLPFLFELAGDAATPDRAAIVELLVSIGGVSVERCDTLRYDCADEVAGYADAAAVIRERAEVFVGFAADADPRVRRAAIPGLALFLDDASRAAALLRDRLAAEPGIVERPLVVRAMATLALRLPTAAEEATAWFDALTDDVSAGLETRLAALAQRSRCAPDRIGPDVVTAAISLLRQIAHAAPPPRAAWADPPRRKAPASSSLLLLSSSSSSIPPQIADVVEQFDRHNSVSAPTTELLRTLHGALGARTAERTALLAEQLRSPDPGTRLDALRMARELMTAWRGDHSALIVLVAGRLDAAVLEVAAEAAAVLEACHPIAEPGREALAECVAAQRAVHGAEVWAAPDPRLRRAHQEAVQALAGLGDARAVPSLLAALDDDVDTWRAVQAAGRLPQAADQLSPGLCRQLRRVDLAEKRFETTARLLLGALAALGDPTALPVITEVLAATVRREQWGMTSSALKALGAFGPASTPALETIRTLTMAADSHVRGAAITALWAVGRDPDEMLPLLREQLNAPSFSWITDAADLLGGIGPAAAACVPRLRELLADGYEWVRVHCAAALWEIAADAEAAIVLDTLLQAWTKNGATANHVVACLDRMGPAAAQALPLLRAELALPRRGGRFASIANDEELQRVSRAIIARLG